MAEPALTVLLAGRVAKLGAPLLRQHFGARLALVELQDEAAAGAQAADFAAAEVLIATRFDATLPAMPRLQLIQLPGAGLDDIEFAAVPAGCRVCNAFEHAIGISEYVMAAILHWTVSLPARHARFKGGDWSGDVWQPGGLRGELAGKTLGCIGYGTIGQAVAARARAFGMRIMAVTRTPRPFAPEPDWLGGYGLTEALLEAADFVVVACPLSAETRGLLGPLYLGAMRPSAYLINVARGPVVDEDVLFEALQAGRIAGAALDVWYRYPSAADPSPRPGHRPFHELDNVLMTPHCSGATEGLIERRFALIADNLERLLAGRPLREQVHPAAE